VTYSPWTYRLRYDSLVQVSSIPEKLEKQRRAAFGLSVKGSRVAQGLSQEDLGFASGMDRTYISGIERGVRNPTVQVIWRLAVALKTTPSALLKDAEQNIKEG
jgi:transcriptional regulator with XRE-family HTH domain